MSDNRIAKSLRGVEVNFDLIEIKNKILNAPVPDASQQRERFIDKRRRRTRKKVDEMVNAQQVNESSVRAALEEERRKRKEQRDAAPHVVIEDTVVEAETPEVTPEGEVAKRRIVKTGV